MGSSDQGQFIPALLPDPENAAHEKGDSALQELKLPPRILVVDDSLSVRLLVSSLLTTKIDATVIEAEDGRAALRVCLENELDCVICDLNMPIMDGMTFLRLLRSHFSRLEVPLLFLTVREDTTQKVMGFKAGASDFLAKPFQSEELIARVETQVSLARMHRASRVLADRLQILVDTDALTGVGNRRAFISKIRAEFGRCLRTSHHCALVMIDVDHFKRVNDGFGHPVGDDVLRSLASVMEKQGREYDTLGRLGGEEFAFLLPEISLHDAVRVAERIRLAVEQAAIGPPELGGVTISAGVALGPLDANDTEEDLFKRADERLYIAKKSGRNRVCGNENNGPD